MNEEQAADVECSNTEVCDWTGTEDDMDCYGQCPKCFEPTVEHPMPR